jgi:uroporphyrin-III C-methyltransferase/precorrin-2 dehydrogenase/sirohydrochlorin ferrochelatase
MKGYLVTLIDLANTACAVIGGGEVAARKVAGLREAGARPVVISPALCESLRRQVEADEIDAIDRQPTRRHGARHRLLAAW